MESQDPRPQSFTQKPLEEPLEQALSNHNAGTFGKGQVSDEPSIHLGWTRQEESLDKAAKRNEEGKQNDFSREIKRYIITTLLVLTTLTSFVGLLTFWFSKDSDQRKVGISAAVAALTGLAGLAAGIGLR